MKLSVKEFLFGGTERSTEGFNSFGHEFASDIRSFEDFKKTVETLLQDYAWDEVREITVEANRKNRKLQHFRMPSNAVLEVWYAAYVVRMNFS